MRTYLTLFIFFLIPLCSFSQNLPAGQAGINVENLEGMSLRNIGPAGMSGRVTSIDVDLSNPEIIYAGTASGGVWRSESGGIKWEPIFDDAPIQSVGALAINQKNPDEIWVGTGEGNPRNSQNSGEGIYKSIDGGKTWKLMGLENTRVIHRILIHRDNPDIVYVGAQGAAWGNSQERGVFKTTDAGKTWKKVLYVNDNTGIADLVIDPTNPNKLLAAMWEFGRKPWTFSSGGKNSGLHITYDGGETWKKLSSEDGLPKGDLGRIGLSFAPSKPNIVYALIEAKTNGLYKSTDGGSKWKLVSEKNIGNRPFYYADIFVDTGNENRIWNLWSYVSKSEDGGKTFETILDYGKGVHPDHHAWWQHPTDPNYIIEGNDGGLNISRDNGVNWRFIENLPLAQFYHINYDMDIPCNVMGGMQDNGSWVGPSSVWKSGGIRNSDWKEVLFGDGFDVMLRRDDNRYGWAMSQGGNMAYFDRETGKTTNVQPVHPDGIELRFNWNAALAQNPFADCGLYFGSQFVHKSMDCGNSWEIISPDLTTNDTMKIRESLETGGLTLDVTRAENHTTILAIAPSPVNENVIWASTDDGNLQLTQNGGKDWVNLANRLSGVPANSWIPYIEVSQKNEGEAFVVVNNYRRNDWKPYVYHTTNFGQTFKRIVDDKKVSGHALCIVQDPVEPSLLFLGTDHGLFFSINKGTNWNKIKKFPSVSTRDLKIHPRDHDLIIGTFGRAAWIMDDIRPFRALTKTNGKLFDQLFDVIAASDGYLAEYASVDGVRFTADGHFRGDNKFANAIFSVWVKEEEKKKDANKNISKQKGKKKKKKSTIPEKEKVTKSKKAPKNKKVKIHILNMENDTMRTFSRKLKKGINRVGWGMNRDGIRYPSWRSPKPTDDPPGNGPDVLPGTYKAIFIYGDFKDSTMVTVHADPRLNITNAQMLAKEKAINDFSEMVEKATEGFERLKEAKKTIGLVNDQMTNAPDSLKKEIKELGNAMRDSISQLQNLYMNPQDTKGIRRSDNKLRSYLWRASGYIWDSNGEPSQMAEYSTQQANTKIKEILGKINTFFESDWKDYRSKVEAARTPIFKDYQPIRTNKN